MQQSIEPGVPGDLGPVVMVVDHEVLVRMAIAAYLRECGLKVIEAGDATEATTVFEAGTTVDVVVAEAQIPGEMDGFALARWIRRHYRDVMVILASSTARKVETARELCEEGPVLEKPYDTADLERRIRQHLSRRGSSGGKPEASACERSAAL